MHFCDYLSFRVCINLPHSFEEPFDALNEFITVNFNEFDPI